MRSNYLLQFILFVFANPTFRRVKRSLSFGNWQFIRDCPPALFSSSAYHLRWLPLDDSFGEVGFVRTSGAVLAKTPILVLNEENES